MHLLTINKTRDCSWISLLWNYLTTWTYYFSVFSDLSLHDVPAPQDADAENAALLPPPDDDIAALIRPVERNYPQNRYRHVRSATRPQPYATQNGNTALYFVQFNLYILLYIVRVIPIWYAC